MKLHVVLISLSVSYPQAPSAGTHHNVAFIQVWRMLMQSSSRKVIMWKVNSFEGLPTHFVASFQIFRSETWSNADGNSGTLFVAGKHTKIKRMLTDPMSMCECLISTQEVAVGVTSFFGKGSKFGQPFRRLVVMISIAAARLCLPQREGPSWWAI
jgi:hypothetical protein